MKRLFLHRLREDLEKESSYILTDPDMYSLHDLIQVKTGDFLNKLREVNGECITHVDKCELCQARGFVCEFCSSKNVIFPWQVKVHRCAKCGACFHLQCFKKSNFCPKCVRINARRSNET